MRWLRYLVFIPALVPACAGRGDPAPETGGRWLTGQLLVATPEMGDPRFDRAVLLMVRHNAEGAFGIIINRAVAERSIATILEAIGSPEPGIEGSVRIYAGGPVQTEIGF